MARNKISRNIQAVPNFHGFKPIKKESAQDVSAPAEFEIILTLEEYESIKLSDYELLRQEDAASQMNVSRPTFTRIYENARRKVAKAFVEGRDILFKGGNYHSTDWQRCDNCDITYSIFTGEDSICPICSNNLSIKLKNGKRKYIICTEDNSTENSMVSGFGRCKMFGVFNEQNGIIEYFPNIYSEQITDAGVKSAEFISEYGAKYIFAAHFGSKASEVLRRKGIYMIIPNSDESVLSISERLSKIK